IRDREAAPVPNIRMERRVADAAQLTLETEGNNDGFGQRAVLRGPILIEAAIAVVELKLPAAVQRLPLFPLKLRLGIFGARDVLRGGVRDQEKCECDSHRKILCEGVGQWWHRSRIC